jgi:hypothetical protein
MPFSIVLMWLWLASGPAAAQDAGEIGLAWDPTGTQCNLQIDPGSETTLYVLARLSGSFEGGFTGAELRVTGLPPEWTILNVTPSPYANVTLGNPLGQGCNIAFPVCMNEPGGVVVLYSIRLLATSAVSERVVSVVGHALPGDPMRPCPYLIQCDGPWDFWGCSAGGTAGINHPNWCSVGVEPVAWTHVRALYR